MNDKSVIKRNINNTIGADISYVKELCREHPWQEVIKKVREVEVALVGYEIDVS